MKIYLFILFIVLGKILSAQQQLFISTDGDDNWSGRLPQSNASKHDGPFKTFERAKKEIEALRSKSTFKSSIVIQVREGTYILNESLQLNEKHSGTADYPITMKNYGNEKVLVTGGYKIHDIKHIT